MGDATALREKQAAAYAAEKTNSRQLWLRLKREWQGASCKEMLRSTAVKETCALKREQVREWTRGRTGLVLWEECRLRMSFGVARSQGFK